MHDDFYKGLFVYLYMQCILYKGTKYLVIFKYPIGWINCNFLIVFNNNN